MRAREVLSEAVTKRPWTFYHGTKSAAFQQFNPAQAAKGEQYWNPLGDGMYVTNNPRFAANFGHNVHKVVIPAGASYKRINMKTWAWMTGPGLVLRALQKAFKMVGENYRHWEHGTPAKSPLDVKKLSREQIIEALIEHYRERASEAEIRQKAQTYDTEWLRRDLMQKWKMMPNDRSGTAQVEGGRVMRKSQIIEEFRRDLYDLIKNHDPYTGLYESSALVLILFGERMYAAYGQALPAVSNAKFGKFDFVVFTETNDIFAFEDEESTSEVVIFNPALQRVYQEGS